MTTALLLLLGQARTPYEMPLGTNQEFQSLVAAVVADTQAGRWKEAKSKAAMLPSKRLTVEYDDGAAPEASRSEFRQGFDDAVAAWKKALPELEVTLAKGGSLKVSYSPELAVNQDTGVPRAAAMFWGFQPAGRLDYVIGLSRSKPAVSTTQNHVTQETVFAIGSALGLAQVPVPDSPLARTDTAGVLHARIDRGVVERVRAVIDLSDRLRNAIAARQPVTMATPKAVFGLTHYDGAPIDEGTPYQFEIPVSNTGTGDLKVAIVPDCSCFTIEGNPVARPGETVVVKVTSDTRGFVGKQEKSLSIYTNDPEEAVRQFRVSEFVRPRFRVIDDREGRPVAADSAGSKATFYVYAPGGKPFKISDSAVNGVTGAVSISPLAEDVADPEMGEGAKRRLGYRVDVLLSSATVTGRVPVTVVLKTDDKSLPYLTHRFVLQKGIAADPEEIYFGVGPRKTRTRLGTLVSATGPFTVTGFVASDPSVSATFEQLTPEKVRMTVVLKDTVDYGDFVGELRIKTDSPTQPVVVVKVRARVQ
jgi:hypothetical protein